MRWRRRRGESLRIFFATDVHGSEQCFRKWLNAASVYRARTIVLGGDVAGKAVVPILQTDDRWIAEYLGEQYDVKTDGELEKLKQALRRRGVYEAVVTPTELAVLEADSDAVAELLDRCMTETLGRWTTLADERLAARGQTGFSMLGNDDPPDLAEVLRQGERLIYAGEAVVDLPGDLQMLSCGFSTPTPWDSPREISEEELGELIEQLVPKVRDMKRTIFNLHCPPRDTKLDQAPMLDAQLRPIATAAGIRTGPVGSNAVREAIERHQPLLGLHGHVHESAGVEQLGSTICINPGSSYGQGVLRGAIIEVALTGEIRSWQLTDG